MSDIKDWSTTAANNNSASPDGFPEGMAPSGVNNSAREVMAAVRTQHEAGGWNDLGHTPTFATTTTFTIATDVTAQYAVNRRIKCTDATTLYGYISASSYGAPNTTVTVVLDSGVLSGSLSAVALSNLSPEAQSRTTGGDLSAAGVTLGIDDDQSADLVRAGTDGRLGISGDAVTTLGGNALFWGSAHATRAGDFEVRTGTTSIIDYDLSDSELTISSNTTFAGDLTASGAISADGGQIAFPATQNASADVNTLDDYEEGTWSPVLSDGTNNATMDGTVTEAWYVKIGKLVTIGGNLGTSSLGSVSGSLRVTGLPFTVSNNNGAYSGIGTGLGNGFNITAGQKVDLCPWRGTTYMQVHLNDNAVGTTEMQATEWSSDGAIGFSGSYIV